MGLLVGENPAWRRYVAVMAALVAALVTILAIGRTPRPREEEPRIRMVDADAMTPAGAIRTELARAASLWLEGRGYECLVPALYGPDESARFSAVMTARNAAGAQRPAMLPDGPVGVLWSRLSWVYDGAALVQTSASVEEAEPAMVTVTRVVSYTSAPGVIAA